MTALDGMEAPLQHLVRLATEEGRVLKKQLKRAALSVWTAAHSSDGRITTTTMGTTPPAPAAGAEPDISAEHLAKLSEFANSVSEADRSDVEKLILSKGAALATAGAMLTAANSALHTAIYAPETYRESLPSLHDTVQQLHQQQQQQHQQLCQQQADQLQGLSAAQHLREQQEWQHQMTGLAGQLAASTAQQAATAQQLTDARAQTAGLQTTSAAAQQRAETLFAELASCATALSGTQAAAAQHSKEWETYCATNIQSVMKAKDTEWSNREREWLSERAGLISASTGANTSQLATLQWNLQQAGVQIAEKSAVIAALEAAKAAAPAGSYGAPPPDMVSPQVGGIPWYDSPEFVIGFRVGVVRLFVPPPEPVRENTDAWILKALQFAAARPADLSEATKGAQALSFRYLLICAVVTPHPRGQLASKTGEKTDAAAMRDVARSIELLAERTAGGAALAPAYTLPFTDESAGLEVPSSLRTVAALMNCMSVHIQHLQDAVQKAGGNPWAMLEQERMTAAFNRLLTDIAMCDPAAQRDGLGHINITANATPDALDKMHNTIKAGFTEFRKDLANLCNTNVLQSAATPMMAGFHQGGHRLRAQLLPAKRQRDETADAS